MENSSAGKRKLRKRAQKRPLADNEENGSCTKRRANHGPKTASTSPEVDKKSRKMKRKVSTRSNKKVCREENNAEVTVIHKIPDEKEKFKIKYDEENDKCIDQTQGNIFTDKKTETKEEVESQTPVAGIQKMSPVPEADEPTSPSNTQQTKYVPRFGKKTKRKPEGMQSAAPKEEEHSNTATNVDTVQIVTTDDSNLVQKHEDTTNISAVVEEERKTVSEDEVVIATTELDTVETMSTEGTVHTGPPTSLEQEQKDKANTGDIIAEEKDSVSETMIINSPTNTSDTSDQHASEGTTVLSSVQANNSEPEIMVTDTTPTQDEVKIAKEEACSDNHTCGDSIASSAVQANRSEPEAKAMIKPQKQDDIATTMEEEACYFPDNLAPQNSKPQTVEGGVDVISAPLTEPDHNTNSVEKRVTNDHHANATDEKVTNDLNTITAEEKVTKTEHGGNPICEMPSGPVVEVARDVLSTIIEKIVTQEAAAHSSSDSATGVTMSAKSQGKEESSEGGPGTDSNEKKVGRKDDDPPDTSASDAQVAAQVTVSMESQGKEERSDGGGDKSGKKVGQKDGDSSATSAADAQKTSEMSHSADGTGQNALQQANELKDPHPTINSSETRTPEDPDQEDSQGLDNFMDSLSSSQLCQMEEEALTTAQQINAVPARQEPDEGARKAMLGLTADLTSLNRSVMSVWRDFNAVQKKRLARKKEQAAKASRAPPNTFRDDGIMSQSVKIRQQGSNIRRQTLQQNPSPIKIGNDKKVSRGPPNVFCTDNARPQPVKQSGQKGSNIRTQVTPHQNPSPMKTIRNDKKVAFNKLDQQKKMDQHKIRPTSLQAMKNREQHRLPPMPKPGSFSKNLTTSKLPFHGTTSQKPPQGISGLYQPNSSSRGCQLLQPNGKPQNGSASTKGSSSNSFNFTPTKPAQAGSSIKMVGQQAAPPSRVGGSHNLIMSCPSVNYRTYVR